MKNVEHTENGFYVVIATHASNSDRDDFVRKVIASGYRQVNFFYDIGTSKYYIYYDTARTIPEGNNIINSIKASPYAAEASLVKIYN